jgi:hypothetical protein
MSGFTYLGVITLVAAGLTMLMKITAKHADARS